MKLLLLIPVMLMTVHCTSPGRSIIPLSKEGGNITYISGIREHENPYPDAETYNFGDTVVHGKVVRSISFSQILESKRKRWLVAGRPRNASYSSFSVIFVEHEGRTGIYSALVGWSFIHDGTPGHGETDGVYHFQSSTDDMSAEMRKIVEYLDK